MLIFLFAGKPFLSYSFGTGQNPVDAYSSNLLQNT
jgi:hypothetical protein